MDVELGAGASWSGESWEPVGSPWNHRQEVEVLRVERALARSYPALARCLGPSAVEGLAREVIAAHPFLPGSEVDLSEVLHVFLGAALEDDPRRGAWLSELALLEEAFDSVRRATPQRVDDELAGGRLLAFEHRVDELRAELVAGGAWHEPAPQPVLLVVIGGADGPRAIELSREQWTTLPGTPLLRTPRPGSRGGKRVPPHHSAA